MHASILVYETPTGFASRSDPAQQDDYWRGTMQYLEALKRAGIFIGGAGLQPPAQVRSLRFDDGKAHVQDGPFADTKEQLGGLFTIDVPDMDTALAWAARFPPRPGLIVEVRPHLGVD
jgi:hypothetical protein